MSVQNRKTVILKGVGVNGNAIFKIENLSGEIFFTFESARPIPHGSIYIFDSRGKAEVYSIGKSKTKAPFDAKTCEAVFKNDFAILAVDEAKNPLFFADCRKNRPKISNSASIEELLKNYEKNYEQKDSEEQKPPTVFREEESAGRKNSANYVPDNLRERSETLLNGNHQPANFTYYDDEAIAAHNYYENNYEQPNLISNGEDNCFELPRNENENIVKPQKGKTAQKENGGYFGAAFGVENSEKNRRNFYLSVQEQIEKIFDEHPNEPYISKIIPDGKWAHVAYDSAHYYLFGVTQKNGIPRYIVYGVEGSKNSPPKGFESAPPTAFIPKNLFFSDGDGYWCLFQNAETGESENRF